MAMAPDPFAGLVKMGETETFTEANVPDALTRAHRIGAGSWGRLVVLSGALDYVIEGPPESRRRIEAGDFAAIEPATPHRVEIPRAASFRVEFYRAPGAR